MGKKKESGPRERIRTGPAFSSRHRSISWLRLITSLIESAPKCAESSLWTRDARSGRRVRELACIRVVQQNACVRACVRALLASKRRE